MSGIAARDDVVFRDLRIDDLTSRDNPRPHFFMLSWLQSIHVQIRVVKYQVGDFTKTQIANNARLLNRSCINFHISRSVFQSPTQFHEICRLLKLFPSVNIFVNFNVLVNRITQGTLFGNIAYPCAFKMSALIQRLLNTSSRPICRPIVYIVE